MEEIGVKIGEQLAQRLGTPEQPLGAANRPAYRNRNHADARVVTPLGFVRHAIAGGPPVRDRRSEGHSLPGQRAKLRPVCRIGVEVGNDDGAHATALPKCDCSRGFVANEFSG